MVGRCEETRSIDGHGELSVQIREACSVSWEEAINSRGGGAYLRKWSEFERVGMAALVPTIVGICFCWPLPSLREERQRRAAVTPRLLAVTTATRTEASLLNQNHPLFRSPEAVLDQSVV